LQYRKVHIIGAPGSGKTFISNQLEKLTNLKAYELDKVFWNQYEQTYVRTNEEERASQLDVILSSEYWIIEGVYYKWLGNAFDAADIIIILNPPVWLRHWRVTKRFLKRKFILGEFHKETLSSFLTLLRWNHKFDDDNMHRIIAYTAEYKSKVIFCRDCDDVKSKLKVDIQ